jgi:hypothetical protein
MNQRPPSGHDIRAILDTMVRRIEDARDHRTRSQKTPPGHPRHLDLQGQPLKARPIRGPVDKQWGKLAG